MNGPSALGSRDVTGHPDEAASFTGSTDDLVRQLTALRQEKEDLRQALGVSTATEIISLLGPSRHDEATSGLTDRLCSLYEERQRWESEMGCSSATEIIELVGGLRSAIRSLVDDSRRRLAYEATVLAAHEKYLS